MKFNKSSLLVISLAVSMFACTTELNNNKFALKSETNNSPFAMASPKGGYESKPFPSTEHLRKEDYHINQPIKREVPKVSFDHIPTYNKENTVPGEVIVIYKNFNKLRIASNMKSAVARTNSDSDKVNNILNQFKIKKMFDLTSPDQTEEYLEEMEQKASAYFNSEIPNMRSMHFYRFPEDVDVEEILSKFRSLPFVRNAYPMPKVESTMSSTQLSSVNSSPWMPSDPDFTPGTEANFWWYFNRHKVFQAWDYYAQSYNVSNIADAPMPKVAVIDKGFDTYCDSYVESNRTDMPNYYQRLVINCNISGSNCNYTYNGDISPVADSNPLESGESHGTMVSSVLGSPLNNNYGVSGIAPGTSIFAIKAANGRPSEYAAGIWKALSRNDVDAINLSIAFPGNSESQPHEVTPISFYEPYKLAIVYAISANIPVIIPAGNHGGSFIDSSIYSYSEYGDLGEIIVGGSENYSGRSVVWGTVSGTTADGASSAVGDRIHLTAGANNILVNFHDPKEYPAENSRVMRLDSGTSLSAPMVAGTIAMMRKLARDNGNPDISPWQLRDLVMYGANLGTYSPSLTVEPNKFVGYNLDKSYYNKDIGSGGPEANIRDLNMYNALVLAKNFHKYQALSRIFNIDDQIKASEYSNLSSPYEVGNYGEDLIFGHNNLSPNTNLYFITKNDGGGATYGYQVYKNNSVYTGLIGEAVAGVSGVYGMKNNNQNLGTDELDETKESWPLN